MSTNKQIMSPTKSSQFWLKVKDIVAKSAIESTAHGLLNISQTNDWLVRVVWISCLLASCGYCTYCVVDVTTDYLSYPVVSNVQVVDELTTSFPTVMICNSNPFDTDRQDVVDWLTRSANLINSTNQTTTWWYSYLTSESIKAISRVRYSLRPQSILNMTRQIHMSLISCSFGSTSCSLDDFKLVYVYDYINCYKFNANGTRMTSRRGFAYGLQLEFYIGNSSSPNEAIYSGNRGMRYMVFNSSFGDGFMYDQGSDAAPGQVTSIQVTKKYYDRLSRPYSDCLSDLTPQNPSQSSSMKIMFQELNQTIYSQIYCQNLCLQRAIIRRCKCYLYRYPYSSSMIAQINNSVCLMDSYLNCALPTIQTLSASGSTCLADCKTECRYFDYDTAVSTSEYMSQWYWSHLKNYSINYLAADNTSTEIERQTFFNSLGQIESLSEARESTLKLNVFLEHIGYIKTSESPFYSFNSFLAAIGGQLGLFLGVSLLSFVELFETIYLIIIAFIGYKYDSARSIKPVNTQKV